MARILGILFFLGLLSTQLLAQDTAPVMEPAEEKPAFELPDIVILGVDQRDDNTLIKEVLQLQQTDLTQKKENLDYQKALPTYEPLGFSAFPEADHDFYRLAADFSSGSYDNAALSGSLVWPAGDWLLKGRLLQHMRGDHVSGGNASRFLSQFSGQSADLKVHTRYHGMQFGLPWNGGRSFTNVWLLGASQTLFDVDLSTRLLRAQDAGGQYHRIEIEPDAALQWGAYPLRLHGYLGVQPGDASQFWINAVTSLHQAANLNIEGQVSYLSYEGGGAYISRVLPKVGLLFPQGSEEQWELWAGQSMTQVDEERMLLTIPYVELNRFLQPEWVDFELMGRYRMFDQSGQHGSMALFFRNMQNYVAYADSDGDGLVEPSNMGARSLSGFEGEWQWNLKPAITLVTKARGVIQSSAITLEAPFTLQGSLYYALSDQTELVLEQRYMSERLSNAGGGNLPGVGLLSLHIASVLKDNIIGYVDATNLLGSSYQWVALAPEPGRAVHLGLKIQLNPN